MSGNEVVLKPEIKSPDYLGHKPNSNEGVIRIGRKPLICVGLGLSVIAGVMTYTLVMKSIVAQRLNEEDGKHVDLANIIPFLDKKQKDGIIGVQKNNVVADLGKTKENNMLMVPPPPSDGPIAADPYADAKFQMWQQQEQEKLRLEQAKRAELKNALNAETTTYTDNQSNGGHQQLYGSVKEEDYSQPQQTSVNIPKEPADGAYVLHTRVQPASPFELKAGTVIPSVMLGGINSDLPGQIMAQVSQSVYDSATGRYLLIPQGSKLVGNYDHQVALGRKRVFIVWHRLIYPDASTVNLENMNGADQSGYAGFGDKTNTHFWTAFRSAILLSAITAGVQLSQPQALTNGGYSSQQMIAAAMGMQMNNLGQQTLARNLNQPPTIEVRPGYIFNVLINKDMILPVWQSNHLAYGGNE